ncbi:Hypothetical protein P9515_05221 [Prochlorococcus marinus str. MIT 9515]|uniref:Uncharacterized protein n=1 Tax=Prochlorococcus marinus (strain MIT 9515) TaxID=167542 RepID=A2BVC0_PROM5|nr:Hypothetical protein P9515_05221 [Prochlorococcus marinus str. MIT 9515]
MIKFPILFKEELFIELLSELLEFISFKAIDFFSIIVIYIYLSTLIDYLFLKR